MAVHPEAGYEPTMPFKILKGKVAAVPRFFNQILT
jgi:hypothetical protein